MTEDELDILKKVAETGNVHPDTFTSMGYVVGALVRRRFLEWGRNDPKRPLRATALLITREGRVALSLRTADACRNT